MSRVSHMPPALRRLPWRILILLTALTGFGLVVLYSAAGGKAAPWALVQGARYLVFLVGMVALGRVREGSWKGFALPAWITLVGLLFMTDAVGAIRGGAQRWLDLGFIRLQPSELMKPVVVLALARFYAHLPPGEVRRIPTLLPAALLVGAPAAVILLQPDLGTALMVVMGGVAVAFLAGTPIRWFAGAIAALAAATPLALHAMRDYQRNRVLIFLDPESDPLGTGYHISQSKIAIGSGGVFGKGFLQGTQSHLDYLPEGHTDFAFATMAEEWGLLGGLFVILCFVLLVGWGLGVARRAPTRFGKLAAGGLSMTIFFYFVINLAMVMGLAPVVGIPLPLISFGGSAMMTVMICVGILMGIDAEAKTRRGGRL